MPSTSAYARRLELAEGESAWGVSQAGRVMQMSRLRGIASLNVVHVSELHITVLVSDSPWPGAYNLTKATATANQSPSLRVKLRTTSQHRGGCAMHQHHRTDEYTSGRLRGTVAIGTGRKLQLQVRVCCFSVRAKALQLHLAPEVVSCSISLTPFSILALASLQVGLTPADRHPPSAPHDIAVGTHTNQHG